MRFNLLLIMILFAIFGCKPSRETPKSDTDNFHSQHNRPKPNYKPETLNDIVTDMNTATGEYIQSDEYKNPETGEEELLGTLADQMLGNNEETAQGLLEDNILENIEINSNENFAEVAEATDKILNEETETEKKEEVTNSPDKKTYKPQAGIMLGIVSASVIYGGHKRFRGNRVNALAYAKFIPFLVIGSLLASGDTRESTKTVGQVFAAWGATVYGALSIGAVYALLNPKSKFAASLIKANPNMVGDANKMIPELRKHLLDDMAIEARRPVDERFFTDPDYKKNVFEDIKRANPDSLDKAIKVSNNYDNMSKLPNKPIVPNSGKLQTKYIKKVGVASAIAAIGLGVLAGSFSLSGEQMTPTKMYQSAFLTYFNRLKRYKSMIDLNGSSHRKRE